MSIKLISVVWSYHDILLKLLHCNFIAVFFLYVYLSKHENYKPLLWWILNFWIIIKKTVVKLQASVMAEEIIYINVSPEFNCNFFY